MAAHEIAAVGVGLLVIVFGHGLRWPVRLGAGAVAGAVIEAAAHLVGVV